MKSNKIKELEKKKADYKTQLDETENAYNKSRRRRYYLKDRIESLEDRIYSLQQGQLEMGECEL